MEQTNLFSTVTTTDVLEWVAALLSFLVSLLTLYNAANLRSGLLAVASWFFGAGMLAMSGALFLLAYQPQFVSSSGGIYFGLIITGFILLGLGSFKIYQMSRI